MTFLGEPFKHDLFVSYSHGDFDHHGISNLKKWSQAFVRELEAEMRMHPKFRDLSIFLDQDQRPEQRIDPEMALPDQLKQEIGGSGIIVVLMSPHYLISRWCRDERDWWFRWQMRQGLPIDGRVVMARIWPTEEPWPDALADERGEPLVGFTFYTDVRPQPYEWPDPTGAKGPFRDALLKMVGTIWLRLEAFKKQLEERPLKRVVDERPHAAASSKYDVFLSYAREDEERSMKLAHELQGCGYSVFWDRRVPPGKTWNNHIFQALVGSRCVIVIWSNESVNSTWVQEEAEYGKKRGILIPVLRESVDPPFGFGLIQAADLTQWTIGARPPGLQDLVDELSGLIGAQR
jgi:hypothetical protein